MARKAATATKEAQPDLLGAAAPQTAKPIAKVETAKQKAKTTVAVVPDKQPMTLIERLRQVSSGKDVAVAKEILAMIRDEEDRLSARRYNEAMLACQSDIPPITRDTYNKHTKSKWAKLEKISKIADPFIRQHGFVLSYGMDTSPLPDHYRVICDVSHREGHTRRYLADVGMDSKGPKGEGNKSLAQGSGSSVTYARRYLKVMIFDIVIEGEDNDGNGSRPDVVVEGTANEVHEHGLPKIEEKQLDTLIDAIEDCGVSRKKFCETYHIAKVADLPAEKLAQALQDCKNFKAQKRVG